MKEILFFLAMLTSVITTPFFHMPDEQARTSSEKQVEGEEDRPVRDPDKD